MEAGRAFAPQVFVAQFEEIFRVRGDSMALPGQATPVGNVLNRARRDPTRAPAIGLCGLERGNDRTRVAY